MDKLLKVTENPEVNNDCIPLCGGACVLGCGAGCWIPVLLFPLAVGGAVAGEIVVLSL